MLDSYSALLLEGSNIILLKQMSFWPYSPYSWRYLPLYPDTPPSTMTPTTSGPRSRPKSLPRGSEDLVSKLILLLKAPSEGQGSRLISPEVLHRVFFAGVESRLRLLPTAPSEGPGSRPSLPCPEQQQKALFGDRGWRQRWLQRVP